MCKKLAIIIFLLLPFSLQASPNKPKIVVSFSILADMTRQVVGDNAEIISLVGANGDVHEYQPSPKDSQTILSADLVIVNGLGLEGWLERFITSSGYKGNIIYASKGVNIIKDDPHAWQDLQNGEIYIRNILGGLIAYNPSKTANYSASATKYISELETLNEWVKLEFSKVPPEKRKVISTHDAFGYFARAYNIEFLAPIGLNTESQPSAKDITKLIDQIRTQKITAVFFENMTDSRIIKQLEKDAGAHIGGTLYSDALSEPQQPAPNYIAMFKYNVPSLVKSMLANQ